MIYGRGRLLIEHRDVGFVEFKLTVTPPNLESGRPGYASGYIYAHQSVIDDAASADHVDIARDDTGGLVRIIINSTLGDGRADVTVSGDPGPETA